MKICLFFQTITRAGGAEKKICELSNCLIRAGYEVHLITLDKVNDQSFYKISNKIQWHKISIPYKNNSILYKIIKILLVRKIFISHSVNVLIGFVMSGDRSMYVASLISGVRIIIAERNSPVMYRYLMSKVGKFQIWLWMHLASKIVIQNNAYKNLYPVTLHKKISVISNFVVLPNKVSCPERIGSNGRFSILSVQRLDFIQKRPDLLIRAFALIADKAELWDLYLLGSGSIFELNKLYSIIYSYNLNHRVKVISAEKNIDTYYLNSNLFAIASLWEGFPNALAEAMSFGLPTVGFGQIIGISDFIGDAGWLTATYNSEIELSQVMLEAINSPDERVRRGSIARQKVEKFSQDGQLKKWENLLFS
jgi:GalNAc-alpha-(1->4)-GalNAc-alpha-(1->3)-diNAcBac-PP-undecaprenol alpha-1,4-N-acetyl-D-galactosaminyltransferase